MLFTTSWDDGYELDLRLGDLLNKYGLTGTFYVCPTVQYGLPMLTLEGLKHLSATHEIGAHTINHVKLACVPLDQAGDEMIKSKAWIEERTGQPCRMFCYPKGNRNDAVTALVKQAGFLGARTVEAWRFEATNPFALPTTIQLQNFPFRRAPKETWQYLDPLGPLRAWWPALDRLNVPLLSRGSWLSVAKHLFADAAQKNQPFFHLWGHASEVDRFRMWDDLDEFFAFVSSRANIQAVTNDGLRQSLGL